MNLLHVVGATRISVPSSCRDEKFIFPTCISRERFTVCTLLYEITCCVTAYLHILTLFSMVQPFAYKGKRGVILKRQH